MSKGGSEPPSRPTIGLLTDSMDPLDGGSESELRKSFDRVCRKLDINLLIAFGLPLESPHPWGAAHNAVYRLMAAGAIDGLILLSSTLATYCDQEGLRRLCREYGPRPLCSVGLAVPGVPSILVDDGPGMEAVVSHLVQEHACRRIGFIGGPSDTADAQIRLDFFRHGLARQGLEYDPELVVNRDYVRHSGRDAVESILAGGVRPDALVVANDGMAIGVIRALRGHGIRVPHDMLVTGVGNLSMGRLTNPPLTTVGYAHEQLAERTIGVVVDQLAGRSVPECSYVPAELLARKSCGCNRRIGGRHPSEALKTAAGLLRTNSERVGRALSGCLRAYDRSAVCKAEPLLAALQEELDGKPDAFPDALEELLSGAPEHWKALEMLQAAVGLLRSQLGDSPSAELEDLWHDARDRISLVDSRHQAHQQSRIEEASRSWVEVQDLLATALDVPDLGRSLTKGLLSVGIRNASIAQYTEDAKTGLESVFCMADGHPRQLAEPRYPAREFWPKEGYGSGQRHTSVVFPLTFEAQPLGVAVFEYSEEVMGYEVLRSQISAALRSVGLHREVVRQTTLHERSVQERIAVADRLRSLSLLAGGVAHDLNNMLSPLVTLPELILQELEENPLGSAQGVSEFRADLETVRTGALRAAQTVRDLLIVGRQGFIDKGRMDLNRVVSASLAILASPRLADTEMARQAAVSCELCPDPLVVYASEDHAVRAISSLLRNAVQSIEGVGRVVIRTRALSVAEALVRYETITPGEYAVVAISDTGPGIPASDLGRIFEPFFRRKGSRAPKGSGLDLAITHAVIKEHGGFVDVESVAGEGSTFSLYFPLASGALDTHRTPTAYKPRPGTCVLVVDDEPAQLQTARRVLEHWGCKVETASSSSQAYQLLLDRATPFDLLMVDMVLHEPEDGLDLLVRVWKTLPDQKALIVSGHAAGERVKLAMERGLVWLTKPYTSESLAKAIRTALGQ